MCVIDDQLFCLKSSKMFAFKIKQICIYIQTFIEEKESEDAECIKCNANRPIIVLKFCSSSIFTYKF